MFKAYYTPFSFTKLILVITVFLKNSAQDCKIVCFLGDLNKIYIGENKPVVTGTRCL